MAGLGAHGCSVLELAEVQIGEEIGLHTTARKVVYRLKLLMAFGQGIEYSIGPYKVGEIQILGTQPATGSKLLPRPGQHFDVTPRR